MTAGPVALGEAIPTALLARVEGLLAPRQASRAFFEAEAERLARCCHRDGRALCAGGHGWSRSAPPRPRSMPRHVAVEFVHPVIVGKRALPAIGLAPEGGAAGAPDRDARGGRRHRDRLRDRRAWRRADRASARAGRARGCLTIAFASAGAEWEFVPPGADPFVRQELVETLYHVLWELVHVFFEHRGILVGDAAERRRRRPVGVPLPVPLRRRARPRACDRRRPRLGADQGGRGRGAARPDPGRERRRPDRGRRRPATRVRGRGKAARVRQRRLGDRRDGPGRRPALSAPGAGMGRSRGDRPHRGPLDPDRDRQRHRAGGDLPAPGDRLRPRERRGDRLLDQRWLREPDRGTRRVAAARDGHGRPLRLRRWSDRRRGARRSRDRQPLAAHPADSGGAGERLHVLRELLEMAGDAAP